MAAGGSVSYQLGREGEFTKLAQTIGTNIQKISQNGETAFQFIPSLSFVKW